MCFKRNGEIALLYEGTCRDEIDEEITFDGCHIPSAYEYRLPQFSPVPHRHQQSGVPLVDVQYDARERNFKIAFGVSMEDSD